MDCFLSSVHMAGCVYVYRFIFDVPTWSVVKDRWLISILVVESLLCFWKTPTRNLSAEKKNLLKHTHARTHAHMHSSAVCSVVSMMDWT